MSIIGAETESAVTIHEALNKPTFIIRESYQMAESDQYCY